MPDIGIPHPGSDSTEPDVFTGQPGHTTDPNADIGVPHVPPSGVDVVYTGYAVTANVGQPHPPGDVGTQEAT